MKRMITIKLLLVSLLLVYLSMNLCSCNQPNLYLPDSACKHLNLIWKYNGLQHWQECTVCGYSTEKENHDTSDNNYEIFSDTGHSLICSICGCSVNFEEHTYNQSYDNNNHWDYCIYCGYKTNIEAHIFGDDEVCDVCYYDKSTPVSSGFGITEIANEPNCKITNSYRIEGTDSFYFKLTSLKTASQAQPTTIEWVVYYKDDNLKDCIVDEDLTNSYEYTFSADKSSEEYQNYKNRTLFVMCTYSNEYGSFSDSSWIGGWEI